MGGASDSHREARIDPEGDALPPGLLEQYQLAVEMADRIAARRATANGFFLTVQTTLVALLSVTGIDQRWIAAAGVVFATAWWILLRSYRALSSAKWRAILSLESRLPAQPFADEWKLLKAEPVRWWQPRYAGLGLAERLVPLVFALLFVTILVFE